LNYQNYTLLTIEIHYNKYTRIRLEKSSNFRWINGIRTDHNQGGTVLLPSPDPPLRLRLLCSTCQGISLIVSPFTFRRIITLRGMPKQRGRCQSPGECPEGFMVKRVQVKPGVKRAY